MSKKILIVEDDAKTVELVKLYLNRDGYKVLTANDGNEGYRLAGESHPDLIVLDLMLPGMDGLEICRKLRSESNVPIIMLTARTTEDDRLSGLDMGADDYVIKPFSPRELAARVRAVLRRTSEDMPTGPVEVSQGNLIVNMAKHEAYLSGQPLNLTPTEFKLLSVFIKDPEMVFSRSQLIDKAFGFDFEGFDRTMDVHIHNLRRKLRMASGDHNYIVTVYGAGYRLIRARI